MRIGGFQSLSLLDFPGKVAAIVFTQGCLFRCSYCHNPELISQTASGIYDENELLELLLRRRAVLDGVVITGGEPTIQKDLLEYMRRIKDMGLLVKLDTNGWRPDVVRHILDRKLVDYFAMDIKAPWKKYEQVISIPTAAIARQCETTMQLIQESGIPHEFRTTIFPNVHNEDDIIKIASYLQPHTTYALQTMRYEKTLMKNLDPTNSIDTSSLAMRINSLYPSLNLITR